MRACLLAVGTLIFSGSPFSAIGLECVSTEKRWAVHLAPQSWESLRGSERGNFSADFEAYGDQDFRLRLETGWVFALQRRPHGWVLRLLESDTPGAIDLSRRTPPLSSAVPNPRDLFGWHFRNRANDGPNRGEVNAPQTLRLFQFSSVSQSSGETQDPHWQERDSNTATPVSVDEGRGWLRLIDYGLSASPVDGKASMNYAKLEACLTWPKFPEERAEALDQLSLEFSDAERELFFRCGLNLDDYQLDPLDTRPRMLTGDVDGDGALDHVVRTVRVDGRRGVAVCRAGTHLDILGSPEHPASTSNTAHVLRAFSQWSLGRGLSPVFGKLPPPVDHDVLILERPEKGMAWVYWQDGQLRWVDVFQFVEP
ncbi:MAG: hypothetical protein Cons2KO_29450 [Congregibacter sp.]